MLREPNSEIYDIHSKQNNQISCKFTRISEVFHIFYSFINLKLLFCGTLNFNDSMLLWKDLPDLIITFYCLIHSLIRSSSQKTFSAYTLLCYSEYFKESISLIFAVNLSFWDRAVLMFYQCIETRKVVKDLGKTGITSVTDPRMRLHFSQSDTIFPDMTAWYHGIKLALFPCVYGEAESASHKRVSSV